MEKLFYKTKHTYVPNNGYEYNDEPSQTVPGEAYSIKELLERYQNGMPLEQSNYSYFDEEDLDQINRFFNPGSLDLIDLEELNQNVTMLQKSVQEAQERQKQAQAIDTPPPPPIQTETEED